MAQGRTERDGPRQASAFSLPLLALRVSPCASLEPSQFRLMEPVTD